MSDNEKQPSSPKESLETEKQVLSKTSSGSLQPQNVPSNPQSPSSEPQRPTTPLQIPASRGKAYLDVPGAPGESRGDSIEVSSPASSTGGTTIYPAHSTSDASGTSDDDALKPDPGNEADFEVHDNRFAFSPGQLNKMLNPKSNAALKALGGLRGLEYGLRTDVRAGLSIDETLLDGNRSIEEARNLLKSKGATGAEDMPSVEPIKSEKEGTIVEQHGDAFKDRLRVYKDNRLPERKAKSIFVLMWIALQDKVLILLSAAAVISLALGLYQTFGGEHKPGEPKVEWVEGVAIIVAIAIVVIVGAGNDYQKERQFVKLNKKKENRMVKVVRSGKSVQISVYDILVGDVMHLEPGDMIPADGVFISGHNVKCDESSATGESDQMKKTGADEVMTQMMAGQNVNKLDPFILSGAKVLEGVGTFLVTSVGVNSSHGKIMMALREDTEATPLQMKLNSLAESIAKLGGASALLLFVVLLIRFLVNLKGDTRTPSAKAQNFMQILITAVTIVVVAVPEGLPLAVTLALAFATTRMLKDNNLVRVLRACETMGNASTVCSDKTGTLTQNKMTVVAGTVGSSMRFSSSPDAVNEKGKAADDSDAMAMNEFVSSLPDGVKDLLLQSIALNSTAFEGEENGQPAFIGSKTETALLGFARDHLGMGPIAHERSSFKVVQLIPFDSARKCMAVVIQLSNGTYRLYVKGASEILLAQCSRILADPTSSAADTKLPQEVIKSLQDTIMEYATRSLRTIGLVYRDFQQWPPRGARTMEDDPKQALFEDIFREMVFLSVVGIQDPLRPGVTEAVKECQKAGVFVRMVTGDNLITAKAIATECGIYTSGGIVMEGPKFRQLTRPQLVQTVPRLQVLARSSPEDKQKLVRILKELGETVAVTGDGTNDGPALKLSDVGFSMGIAGTEVAKEASAIILMDDNFASIVKALMWGRAVNDAVKKFLQFQLTVNITAVLLAFVSAVASSDETSVLSAVQLLWVNLIMDTFAALALATDPPNEKILNRPPQRKSAPLITITMWKMILGQAIYQLVVTYILHFAGARILKYDSVEEREQLDTLVFNTFVWMQIFNQYNNRRLDNNFNIFEGVFRNWFFIGINLIMIGGQVMIIFVGGRAFSVTPLNGSQWGISLILGAISLIIAVVIRLIPDPVVEKLLPSIFYKEKRPDNVYASDNDRFEWNQAIQDIREELQFLKMVRGGRLNQLKFKSREFRHRLLPSSKSGSIPHTPIHEHDPHGHDVPHIQPPSTPGSHRRRRSRSNSAFAAGAMVPAIIAGSIGGWSPVERVPGADSDSLRFGPVNAGSRERLGSPNSPSEEGVKRETSTKSNEHPSPIQKPADDNV